MTSIRQAGIRAQELMCSFQFILDINLYSQKDLLDTLFYHTIVTLFIYSYNTSVNLSVDNYISMSILEFGR